MDNKGLYSSNKMCLLKDLTKLKCESRTNQHAVQYKYQPGFVMMFCSYVKNVASLDTLFLGFLRQQAWVCS